MDLAASNAPTDSRSESIADPASAGFVFIVSDVFFRSLTGRYPGVRSGSQLHSEAGVDLAEHFRPSTVSQVLAADAENPDQADGDQIDGDDLHAWNEYSMHVILIR